MQMIYGIQGNTLVQKDSIGPNTLVSLVDPTEDELAFVASSCGGIDRDDLRSALDAEEISRVEIDERYILIVLDVPVRERRDVVEGYQTYPMAIIMMAPNIVITISLVDFNTSQAFFREERKVMVADGRPRFAYEVLMSMALAYQKFLRELEARRDRLVKGLNRKTTKADLIQLYGMESDLVFFETSLNANKAVLDRAAKSTQLVKDDADRELFDDILIEIGQASEMAHIYQKLISSTRDLFTSVMDNGLNSTMKVLTSITLIMAIPTVLAGLWGMNVAPESMPFSASPFGFAIVFLIALALCLITAAILHKKNLL